MDEQHRGAQRLALYEAWAAQRIGPVTVQAGVLELSRHFDVNEPALVFLNSSQSNGAEIGLSGVNGPSSFPNTGLGVRAEVRSERSWLQIAASDGVPGSPVRNDFALRAGEGLFVLGEAGHATERVEITGGAWAYTTDGAGAYGMLEADLLREAEGQGVAASLRLGLADPTAQRFAGYTGGSITWTGAMRGREGDVLGLAISTAWTGGPARAAGARPAESAVELTWLVAATPWLVVQPDVQWVLWPDADPAKPSGVLGAVRVIVAP